MNFILCKEDREQTISVCTEMKRQIIKCWLNFYKLLVVSKHDKAQLFDVGLAALCGESRSP